MTRGRSETAPESPETAAGAPALPVARPTNCQALEAILAGVESKAPALAALAWTLAAKLDADAGLATAAVAREYRAVLDALARAGDSTSDPFAALLAEMGDAP